MWAIFEYEISYLQGRGDVILMGDLNARTGELELKCIEETSYHFLMNIFLIKILTSGING